MSKAKRGLGKGLGALFGEDVVQETGNPSAKNLAIKNVSMGSEKMTDQKVDSSQENGAEADHMMMEGSIEDRKDLKTGHDHLGLENSHFDRSKEEAREVTLKISKIEPNRSQPRKDFNEDQLQELADSIKQYGILQPLLVQRKNDYYEIIAGERRWRAAKLAGLKEVPVVIREYNEQQAVEVALIENVQREDLNPIEEAAAYHRLMQEFHLKQEEIAERVGKNRTTITNSMRLLHLRPEVQQMLIEGGISSGHARALLAVEDADLQLKLAQRIAEEHLSVREVEKAVKMLGKVPSPNKKKQEDEALELIFRSLEDRLKTVMGTKVNISRKDKNKGRIEIEYYSESELERIVELIESIR